MKRLQSNASQGMDSVFAKGRRFMLGNEIVLTIFALADTLIFLIFDAFFAKKVDILQVHYIMIAAF